MNDDSSRNALDRVADSYTSHPLLRAAVQALGFIPGVAPVDAALVAYIERVREHRLREFFEEIARSEKTLTWELVHSEPFLHVLWLTGRLVVNTRRNEKIRLFGRMVRAGIEDPARLEDDRAERYVAALDTLSIVELQLLWLYDRSQQEAQERLAMQEHESVVIQAVRLADLHQSAYYGEVESVLGLSEEETRTILIGTQRTGFYEPLGTGGFWGDEGRHRGRTTTHFRDFCRWLEIEEADLGLR